MASYFYRDTSNFLTGVRNARARDKKGLSKLYSDNKQALEAARLDSSVTTTGHYGPANVMEKSGGVGGGGGKSIHEAKPGDVRGLAATTGDVEDLNLAQLRKEFQYQQDRLLAWGVGWSEICARRGSQHQGQAQGFTDSPSSAGQTTHSPSDRATSGGGHGESKGDFDQVALGDLVASIMDEIKKLLDQSGQLSHPGRYGNNTLNFDTESGSEKTGRNANQNHNQNLGLSRQKTPPSFAGESPKIGRKDSNQQSQTQTQEWKQHELTTGRALLDQLKSCIDVLYSLVDNLGEGENVTPPTAEKGPSSSLSSSSKIHRELPASEFTADASRLAFMQKVHSHPFYIDFARLQPMHDPTIDGDYYESGVNLPPPSYDDTQQLASSQARSIYYYAHAQAHVIVDLVSVNPVNLPSLLLLNEDTSASPFQDMYSLAQKLSGDGLLSWDGHMKVLGFTLAGSKYTSRFGLVYALPAPSDPTVLQSYQTLNTTLLTASSTGYGSNHDDSSIPPLENKFRLAYNIALLAAGYLAHGTTHGHIRSNNIMFLRENDNARNLGKIFRTPYLMQPVQSLVGLGADALSGAPASEAIYHHPDADHLGYGTLAAHDIYSVGLLLLEVGMWLPLRRFWKPKYDQDRHIFVDRLRRTYAPKLASKCGSRYMKIVQKCLGAPVELATRPGITDAAEYLLEILKDLSQCCALDEAGTPSPLDIEVIEALIDECKVNEPEKVAEDRSSAQQDKALPVQPAPVEQLTQSRQGGPSSKRRAGQPALRKFPDMPIPQDKLNTWNTVLLPRLQKILTRVLADSPESASANLMMIGPNPEKVTTTIVVQCSDTGRVHEELKAKLKGKLGIGRGWGLVVIKGEIRRSGKHREPVARRAGAARRSKHDGRDKTADMTAPQRKYQPRPTTGASIGVFKDGEHLPPVSLGGVILVDGKPFTMSVHHMLDDVSERGSDDEDSDADSENEAYSDNVQRSHVAQKSSLKGERAIVDFDAMGSHMDTGILPVSDELDFSDDEIPGDDFMLYDSDSESDASTIRPDYSMFDDDGNEYWFMDEDSVPDLEDDELSDGSSSDESVESIGDRPGFSLDTDAFDDDEICVTQPALDDVDEDFFPSLEDRDDDHLSSHSLGFVHASSGIRRKVYNNMKHEIDWALVRINDDRCSYLGRRSKPSRHAQTHPLSADAANLTKIAPFDSLPHTRVATVARTSGPARGRISQALSLIKFHGRTSFSSSYTIDGGFGVPGDSGAWVWDEDEGRLCGHVLAWAEGLKVAFLGPMEVMLEDMKEKLGASRIELAGAAVERERCILKEVKSKRADGMNVEAGKEKKLNEQIERARELQVALKRMSLDSTTSVSNAGRSRDNSGDTFMSRSSRCSSASSAYSNTEGDTRPKKERFDLRMSGHGGQEVMQIPMARALS